MDNIQIEMEDQAVQLLLNCGDSHSTRGFDEFYFTPRNLPDQHIPCFVLKMFDDLGFISPEWIERETLARFIIQVKKGYNDKPFHNWVHAFSVAHFAYLLIINLDLVIDGYMTQLEALVFIVSCLCHDIDHQGTNNSFEKRSYSGRAKTYGNLGSIMERYHLERSMAILKIDRYNIFKNLPSDQSKEALVLLERNILATDLFSHFEIVKKQCKIAATGFKKDDLDHKIVLHAMLMTCCDLSDQTKDWESSQPTAEKIYEEFFLQGDKERELGLESESMMDRRESWKIPNHQVSFITGVVLSPFTNLAKMFPTANCLVKKIKNNLEAWRSAQIPSTQ